MHPTRFSRKETAATALVYAFVAVAAYRAVLRSGFVADDWIFLSYAVPAHGIGVCFAPLVGHFVRPMVMLTYYANHRVFGLWPLPFHLTVVAVHVASACLVAQIAVRLTGSKRAGFWAGAIFTAFAGHSEAVGWVAGAADPWLALFLMAGLLLFAKGLESDRPVWPLTASTLVLMAAYLAKESAAISTALVLAWGVSAAWFGDRQHWRRTLIRTAAVGSALTLAFALYLMMRAQVFGSAFGSYNDLNADRSILGQQLVAFVLRSFFPASTSWIYPSRRMMGLALIAAATLLVFIATRRQPAGRGGLLVVWAGFAIALAPVAPLTIALAGSTSERFVYIPTVFSCILIAWAIVCLLGRWRLVEAGAVVVALAVQYPALTRANAERVEAAGLFQTFMTETVSLLRAEAPTNARVFFLTLPDSLRGTVVVRSAFHPALSVLAPEITDPEWRAVFIASHDLHTTHDQTALSIEGPQRFRIGLSAGHFLEARPPGNADFAIEEWSSTGYLIQFKPSRWRRVVAYETGGHLLKAGGLEAAVLDAVPFGVLDTPAEGAVCHGSTLRFSGWALDDEPAMTVRVLRQGADGRWSDVAKAERRSGTRPDIVAMFAGYPGVDSTEWDYWLPCSSVGPDRAVRLRIVAQDSAGQEVTLGERTVVPAGR